MTMSTVYPTEAMTSSVGLKKTMPSIAQTFPSNPESRPMVDMLSGLGSATIAIDLRSRPDLTPAARLVWIFLYRAYHAFHGRLYTGLAYIAREVGYSIRTVRRALRQLEKAHLITLIPQIRQPNPRTKKGGGGTSTWRFRVHWRPYESPSTAEKGPTASVGREVELTEDASAPVNFQETSESSEPIQLETLESGMECESVVLSQDLIDEVIESGKNGVLVTTPDQDPEMPESVLEDAREAFDEPGSMTGAPRSFCPPLEVSESRMALEDDADICDPIPSTALQEVDQPEPKKAEPLPEPTDPTPKAVVKLQSSKILRSVEAQSPSGAPRFGEDAITIPQTLLAQLQERCGFSLKQSEALIGKHGQGAVSKVLGWVVTAPVGRIRHPKAWLVAALNEDYEVPSWVLDAQTKEASQAARLAQIDEQAAERQRQDALAREQRQASEEAWLDLATLVNGPVGHRLAEDVAALLATQIPDGRMRQRLAYPESPIWRAAWLTVWQSAGCPRC